MTGPPIHFLKGLGQPPGETMDMAASGSTRRARFLRSEREASLVEYALLVALIAVVSFGPITLVGERVLAEYDCVTIEIDNPGIKQRVIDKMKNGKALANHLEERVADFCL